MRPSLLLVALFASGCVFPNYQSSKVVELTLPADSLSKLECDSHNGGITITGDAAATTIALKAEISVRGYSQEEADANLHLLEVGREQSDGTLRIFGKYPPDELDNRSPSFKFTMTVPQRLALKLVSHNGNIAAKGTEGVASLETHNGDIDGSLRTNRVSATTHNGNVDLRIDGEGALDGEVNSHNGNIGLTLAEGLGTRIDASTHNGRVTPPAKAADAATSRSSLTCRVGDGSGRLVVQSHNGNVVFR